MGKSTSVAFSFSKAGRVIPATTATVSALSSILVMTTIARSKTARNSAYHFILFFMSFGDAIASIAMALTTIPMPTDVHDFYAFDGKSYGNKGTCEAQGFAIFLGMMLSVSSSMILNLYYVCTIRYGMREEKFKKKVLPVALLLSAALSISVTVSILSSGFINPRPFEPYCLVGPYPMDCKKDEATDEVYECERGGANSSKGAYLAITIPSITVLVTFFVVVCSMFLVIGTVYNTEMSIRKRTQRDTGLDNEGPSALEEFEFKQTRVVLRQALMYIGAFLITWLWLLMLTFVRGEGSHTFYRIVDPLKVIFQPLQGFFNAWIFLSHKAHSLRKSNSNLTFFKALVKSIVSPHEVPGMLISSIDMLDQVEVEDVEDVEADPAFSFPSLPSNGTPSLNLSKVLSVSTNINNMILPGTDRIDNNKKEPESYSFYKFPISDITKDGSGPPSNPNKISSSRVISTEGELDSSSSGTSDPGDNAVGSTNTRGRST